MTPMVLEDKPKFRMNLSFDKATTVNGSEMPHWKQKENKWQVMPWSRLTLGLTQLCLGAAQFLSIFHSASHLCSLYVDLIA